MLFQLLQRNADRNPASVAVTFGARSISHAELLHHVERCARGLASCGLHRGERVALLLDNGPDFITSFFAIAACGAVAVPLSPDSKEDEIRSYMSDADIRFVIAERRRSAAVSDVVRTLEQRPKLIVNGEGEVDGAILVGSLGIGDEDGFFRNGDLDDDVVYLYSSGSTGRPKCVPRTAIQYWWEADSIVAALGLSPADVIFCAIPLHHNYGLVECMLAAAMSGARLVILENPNPFVLRRGHVLSLLERERVTVFPGVPLMFQLLAESSMTADLSALRACLTGAAVVPRQLFDDFLAKFGVPIRQHYGSAETGAIAINLDADASSTAASVGRAFPGVHVVVLDDAGGVLPAGQAGEVAVRSRAMTRGYRGREGANETAFRDGFFLTGDIGRFDEAGRLYLLGRKKFVIEVVGQKVDPLEVEDALIEHDGVREALVIGIPAAGGSGEMIKAYVVATRSCDEGELAAFCRKRLANFKVPQVIEFVPALPRDTLGKVVRNREILERRLHAEQPPGAGLAK